MNPAVHDFRQGRSYSRAEFDALTSAAAADICNHLPQPHGLRVAGLSRNGVELLALFFGCMRVGAIFVPLNWRLSRPELAALLADCDASLVYSQAEFRASLDDASTPVLALDTAFDARPSAAQPAAAPAAANVALLLYTSGTSGRPKGVILTVANLRAASENFRSVADVTPASVLLCDSPMFHVIGLVVICHTSVTVGASVYLSPAFNPDETVARIADERLGITHYLSVPQVAEGLLRSPAFAPEKFRRLRALFVGGAPLPRELVEKCRVTGVTLINSYGSSEAGTSIHMPLDQPPDIMANKPGSIGLPAALIDVSLRDRDGQVVPPASVGEIWLRGPSLTAGYWNRLEDTAQAFSDGWFRTGDAARQDADGYYYIVDRWKDMYISGGENVYPAEVERVLACMPGISEVTVVGQPDPHWGEVGEAFVVLVPGAQLTADAVIAFARPQLAGYKLPKRVQFVASLPRTATGKVTKSELRRR